MQRLTNKIKLERIQAELKNKQRKKTKAMQTNNKNPIQIFIYKNLKKYVQT